MRGPYYVTMEGWTKQEWAILLSCSVATKLRQSGVIKILKHSGVLGTHSGAARLIRNSHIELQGLKNLIIFKIQIFQFNLIFLFEFSIYSIQFECLVWIFNFFQFNLNILFEFSIFFNSIWMSCLNCQFLSILTLSTQFFFSNGFFLNWCSN